MTESAQFRPMRSRLRSATTSCQWHRRVLDVVRAAPEPLLLAARHQEQQRPVRAGPPGRLNASAISSRPATPDALSSAPLKMLSGRPGSDADVVEMGRDHHVFVAAGGGPSLPARRRGWAPPRSGDNDARSEGPPAVPGARAPGRRSGRGGGEDPARRAGATAPSALSRSSSTGAPAFSVAKIGRQPRLQRGLDPPGEGRGIAVGQQDHGARHRGYLVYPVVKADRLGPLEIERQEHDAATQQGTRRHRAG